MLRLELVIPGKVQAVAEKKLKNVQQIFVWDMNLYFALVHYNPLSKKWDPDLSYLQLHVNLAIAFTIWRFDR